MAAVTDPTPASTRPPAAPAVEAGFELHGPVTALHDLLAALWHSRAIVAMLARKDFLARYRRTSLGMLWALGLPVLQAAVLTVVFSRVGHFGHTVASSSGTSTSYAVFVYAGIVGWSYFASTLPAASTAIVDNVSLAGKVYFPRLILPLVVVGTGLYPLVIGVALLLGLTLLMQHSVGVDFLWVLPAAALAVGITAGFGLLLSALHVFFRDVKYIVQAAMLALFYATPVIYSLASVPGRLGEALTYGPMSGPIELLRLATSAADPHWGRAVLAGVGWCLASTAAGLALQSRFDRVFADRL